MKEQITVETTIEAPIEKIWMCWTEPTHIMRWNNASSDWHTPHATNDLRTGGTFSSRMEAKDGSAGFDFTGTYTDVVNHEHIRYVMEDGRVVDIAFSKDGNGYKVTETFDAESENPIEMQRSGWQSILENFKTYVMSI